MFRLYLFICVAEERLTRLSGSPSAEPRVVLYHGGEIQMSVYIFVGGLGSYKSSDIFQSAKLFNRLNAFSLFSFNLIVSNEIALIQCLSTSASFIPHFQKKVSGLKYFSMFFLFLLQTLVNGYVLVYGLPVSELVPLTVIAQESISIELGAMNWLPCALFSACFIVLVCKELKNQTALSSTHFL